MTRETNITGHVKKVKISSRTILINEDREGHEGQGLLYESTWSYELTASNAAGESTDGYSIRTSGGDQENIDGTSAEASATTDDNVDPVSYTHLRAHETREDLVFRVLL